MPCFAIFIGLGIYISPDVILGIYNEHFMETSTSYFHVLSCINRTLLGHAQNISLKNFFSPKSVTTNNVFQSNFMVPYLNLYHSNIFLFGFQLKFEVSLPMYYLSIGFKQST
jgi:hypothetical protein